MTELLNNQTFVWGAMAMIAFLVTQGLKWAFIKPYTKKLDKRKKTILNSLILILAFGSAVLCEFLYSRFWLGTALNLDRALNGWGGASGIYGIFEWFIKLLKGEDAKLENPYETKEAEDVKKVIKDVTKDGKIDKSDSAILKDFADKLNRIQ
jgi:hypothetical protein